MERCHGASREIHKPIRQIKKEGHQAETSLKSIHDGASHHVPPIKQETQVYSFLTKTQNEDNSMQIESCTCAKLTSLHCNWS
jgi:hypothetical protein